MWNSIFGGASSAVSLTDEGSVITVNSATDGGMILIVLKNNGPGTFNLASVNITSATGQDVNIVPVGNTQATFGGALLSSNCPNNDCTGSINGGVGVGYIGSGSYLVVPPGQSASFRVTVTSGLAELFPPDQNFQILAVPHGGTLIRLTVQSISQ